MESFTRMTGIAAPMLSANIDTDQIIPTRFLRRLSEEGLGEGLFAEWRVQADGTPDPTFVLNRAPWNEATILVAGPNFGCGSSREAAPRAMRQHGFRAVVASSFGDIFFSNCFRCGLLPVRLPAEIVDSIGARLQSGAIEQLHIDLNEERLQIVGSDESHSFNTPPRLRQMLLLGLDEIEQTLLHQTAISAFRERDRSRRPWVYRSPDASHESAS